MIVWQGLQAEQETLRKKIHLLNKVFDTLIDYWVDCPRALPPTEKSMPDTLLLIIITTRIKILKHPLYAYETSLLTMRWALTMSRTAAHRTTKLKSRKSRLIWKVYHNANNDLLSCCIKAVAEKDTIRSEHPVNKTNIYMEKYLQCLVLANGYPHCAQRLFWMWKELRPHRRQRVWVLFLRLPKLVVPLVYNKKLTN